MKFIVTPGPYQRGSHKTGIIMRDLMIALLIVWAAGIAYNFTIGVAYGLKAIVMVLVASLVTLLCDILVHAIRYKPEQGAYFKTLLMHVRQNFSLVTAVIFALTLPIGTPYYVIVIGSIFATLLVKYAFGGFGANIFNPAAFARIFVALTFASSLVPHLGNPADVPTLTAGATITTAFANLGSLKWIGDTLTGLNVNMGQVWLGLYSGAVGEPFALLILLVGIWLAYRKALNWRTPVSYLGTVAITAFVIALFAGINPFDYILLHLGLGGLMFGAVFMLTDPVSGPTSPFGKIVIGIIAGLMTVLIRIQGNLPEGVIFAIAIANVLSPLIDRLSSGMTNLHMQKKWLVIGGLLFGSLSLNGGLAFAKVYQQNQPSSSSESSSEDISSSEPSSEEPIIPFKVLSGAYASIACEDYCAEQTQEVNVNLNERFEILSIELIGTNTTGNPYRNNWNNGEAAIVAYYESLTIAQIQALDPLNLPNEAFVAGVTVTAERLLRALQDALDSVEIYTGSATSNAEEEHYADQTTNVTVYVIGGVIECITLSGQVAVGTSWINSWNSHYQTIFDYYVGMTVVEIQALGTLPHASDGFVAGLTYSTERLFDAIIDALSTYGG